MVDSHLIMVASQKGGVGKTTVAVNLATALKLNGYRVLLIDADYTNPSVGFHLGMQEANCGFMDVAMGKARLENAVAIYGPSGLHVLPGQILAKVPRFTGAYMHNLNKELVNSKYDFIIIDTAPGPMPADMLTPFINTNMLEALILLTPEMSACASAIRLAHTYNRMRITHFMVANRVKSKGYELGIGEIEDVLGEGILVPLPEDENVPASIGAHIPDVVYRDRSRFSTSVKDLATKISHRSGIEAASGAGVGGLFAWIRRVFFGR